MSSKDELTKSIDLWLQWDQCKETRQEIEQLKVKFFLSFSTGFFVLSKYLVGIEMG